MKMDRNLPGNLGLGKYALIKLRPFAAMYDANDNMAGWRIARVRAALATLLEFGMLDYGDKPETEFFVMRVKDKYAGKALEAYGMAVLLDDSEYAEEILELASRAGENSPYCKAPD